MTEKRKKPYFMSQDYFRYPKLRKRWRSPKGLQSKLRLKKGGSGKLPRIGYSEKSTIRNLVKYNNEYYKPVIVRNERDLDNVKEKCIAVLASGIGAKKVLSINEKAKSKNIKFLYTKRVRNALKTKEMISKRKEKKKESVKREKQTKKESEKQHDSRKESSAEKKSEEKKEVKQESTEKEIVHKDIHENKENL